MTREGEFVRAGLENVDEAEIFDGRDNKLTLIQTYSKKFHCTYLLHNFPFDNQVKLGFKNYLIVRHFSDTGLKRFVMFTWF